MNSNEIINTNYNKGQIKPIINYKNKYDALSNLTLNDLAKLVLFKFGSMAQFGRKLGVGRARACQILKGYGLPIDTESIKKIANVLDIDVVVLAQVFARADNKNREVGNNDST